MGSVAQNMKAVAWCMSVNTTFASMVAHAMRHLTHLLGWHSPLAQNSVFTAQYVLPQALVKGWLCDEQGDVQAMSLWAAGSATLVRSQQLQSRIPCPSASPSDTLLA